MKRKKNDIFYRLGRYVENFGLAEKRMNSICDDICTSEGDISVATGNNLDSIPQFLPSINEQKGKANI